MTWEELKEKAKEMGATIYISPYGDGFERIDFNDMSFFQGGCVSVGTYNTGIYLMANIATDRTNDQMLAIMKALQ